MKLNKGYKKFYEIGDNAYYLLSISDETHIATESFVELDRRFFSRWLKPKRLTQGLKLLQYTPSISILFDEIMNLHSEQNDKGVVVYDTIDDKKVRNTIKDMYQEYQEVEKNNLLNAFERFKSNMYDKYTIDGEFNEDLYNQEMELPNQRLQMLLDRIESTNPFKNIILDLEKDTNVIIKKMLTQNFKFLYSQKVGSFLKINYLYDFDIYGTLTIYKVQTIKDVVKSVESFVYNIDIIRELTSFMINKELK